MRRWLRFVSGLTFITLLAGCGTPTAHRAASHPQRPAAAPVHVTAASVPTRLRPVAVLGPRHARKTEVVQAALMNRSTKDTLTVTTNASGAGTLVVKNPTGATVWTLPHVSWVGVLTFGAAHLPVIVTQGDQSLCGSGGCSYTTYTYTKALHKFAAIPGAPAMNAPTYRLNPSTQQWQTVPPSSTRSFFGLGSLTRSGFTLTDRLYDNFQHAMVTRYTYVPEGGPVGHWTHGSPAYVPSGALPVYPAHANEVVEAFLTAAALNLPHQAAEFMAPGTQFWHQIQSALPTGTTPGFDSTQWDSLAVASGQAGQLSLYETVGTGLRQRLVTDTVTAHLQKTKGRWKIIRLHLSPIPMPYATIGSMLAAAGKSPLIRNFLDSHPQDVVTAIVASGPETWTFWLGLSPGGQTQSYTFNAKTGLLSSRPSG